VPQIIQVVTLARAQGSVMVFIWPGTVAQIGTGFVLTLAFLLMAMAVHPFQDRELGFMYSFSLFIQVITLYTGIMLASQK
jgi:hypothetical protein